jgi:hypothetical protein
MTFSVIAVDLICFTILLNVVLDNARFAMSWQVVVLSLAKLLNINPITSAFLMTRALSIVVTVAKASPDITSF